MDHTSTPRTRKRGLDDELDQAATPRSAALKRRRIHSDAASPTTPRQAGAVSAVSNSGGPGVGSQQQQQQQQHIKSISTPLTETSPNINAHSVLRSRQTTNDAADTQLKPQSPLICTPGKARPAIKLAALRGTKWDTGELKGSPSPQKTPRGRRSVKKGLEKTGRSKRMAPVKAPKRGRAKARQPEVHEKSEDAKRETSEDDDGEEDEDEDEDEEEEEEEKEKVKEKEEEVPERAEQSGRGRGRGRGRGTRSGRGTGAGRGRGRGTGRGRGRRPKNDEAPPATDMDELTPDNSPSKTSSPLKRIGILNSPEDMLDSAADELSSNDYPEIGPLKHRPFDLNTRLATSNGNSPLPKGILSPSKKSQHLKKSVTFNGTASEVFFEDLPKALSAKKTTRQTKLVKPADPKPEDDEIVCAICSRPDSEAPNEIILCDNCDFAAHQVCYGVPEIPEGDWLCKFCTQEDVLNGTPRKAARDVEEAKIAASKREEIPDIPHFDHHLRALQRVLLDRCAGRRRIRMFGQDEAYEKAQQLVERTVAAGEGNSMLLIGPRGCGKTTMLENIIEECSRQHGRDFYVVRLNGFIHTDDKLALKEIWRQLGKEMNVEDDLLNRSNYADTMASLLALLSHPSEILGTDDGVTCQSVIFIIDEFDMFAAHPRQTLLYNLFDIAQSRKAPIAVLGCTTRLDVVEMLEKRVKSRFSHRYVYLSLPKGLPAYWQICRQGLMLGDVEPEEEDLDPRMEGHAEFHIYWNEKIQELYDQQAFQGLLQYHFYTTKSPSAFFNEWILPLSAISSTNPRLAVPTTWAPTSLHPPDSRIQLLPTLSDLELGLLIAGARLDIVADTDTVNFAMVYDEYSSLVGRQRAQSATSGMLAIGGGARVWSRGVAGIAWERLIALELLVPAGVGVGAGVGSRATDGKMWRMDVALEEIPGAVKLSTVLAKWCKEL